MDNEELVDVGLDGAGALRTVAVEQRLTVRGIGDLVLNIPAPTAGVSRLPDSDSTPGMRRYSVVWIGFSPGRKLLAARVRLRPDAIAPLVPLRVAVRARVDGKALRARASGALEIGVDVLDVAHASTRTFGGNARPAEVAQKLDEALNAFRLGRKPRPALVSVPGSFEPQLTRVTAAFTVQTEVTVPGRFENVRARGARIVGRSPLLLRFSGVVSGQRPALHAVVTGRGTAAGQPHVRLVASPAPPKALLVPPGGKTWAEALRTGLFPRDGRKALAIAIERLSSAAFTHQYEAFLASPDLAGKSRTSYRFETTAAPRALPVTRVTGGPDWTLRAVGIALAALGAGGLVVWWAHS